MPLLARILGILVLVWAACIIQKIPILTLSGIKSCVLVFFLYISASLKKLIKFKPKIILDCAQCRLVIIKI